MNPKSVRAALLAALAIVAVFASLPRDTYAQGPLAGLRNAVGTNRGLVRASRADAIAARQANVDLLRATGPSSAALRVCHPQPLVAPVVAPIVQAYHLPAAIVAPPVYVQPAPVIAAPLIVPGYTLPAAPLTVPAPLTTPPTSSLVVPIRAAATASHAQSLVVPRCHF
jgi:hypothetical protein